MMTGTTSRLMRNALVRIAVPNSVDATTQIFFRSGRMGERLRHGLDLGRGDADEDVVKRRPCDLELEDAGPANQRGEQVLGVSPPPHLLDVPLIVDLLDTVQPGKGVHAGLGPHS